MLVLRSALLLAFLGNVLGLVFVFLAVWPAGRPLAPAMRVAIGVVGGLMVAMGVWWLRTPLMRAALRSLVSREG